MYGITFPYILSGHLSFIPCAANLTKGIQSKASLLNSDLFSGNEEDDDETAEAKDEKETLLFLFQKWRRHSLFIYVIRCQLKMRFGILWSATRK